MASVINWPPLGTPMPYDPAFKVEVCLQQPLWGGFMERKEVTIIVAAIAAQIDLLCRKELIQIPNNRIDNGNISTNFEAKAVVLLDQLKTCIKKLPHPQPLPEDFLDYTGIAQLYPRAAAYVTWPQNMSVVLKKTPMDSYHSKMGSLQQLLILAHQINSDVTSLSNHKYIAHQVAMLYQSLSPYSDNKTLAFVRSNIEDNFKDLKESLIPEDEEDIPTLIPEKSQWLLDLTSTIVNTITKFPKQLTEHMIQPARVAQHFS